MTRSLLWNIPFAPRSLHATYSSVLRVLKAPLHCNLEAQTANGACAPAWRHVLQPGPAIKRRNPSGHDLKRRLFVWKQLEKLREPLASGVFFLFLSLSPALRRREKSAPVLLLHVEVTFRLWRKMKIWRKIVEEDGLDTYSACLWCCGGLGLGWSPPQHRQHGIKTIIFVRKIRPVKVKEHYVVYLAPKASLSLR